MHHDPDATRQAELWDLWAAAMPDLYPDRDPSEIVRFLSELPGPHLDLGAGSGRVAVPLAAAGCDVTALELVPKLASRMRERAAEISRLAVVEADMADFGFDRSFGAIFAVRSTFFHLCSPQRQVDCLRTVAKHLQPGGTLVLDCYVPDLKLLQAGQTVQMVPSDDEAVQIRACTADIITQRITYREIRLAEGELPRVLPVEQRFCWPGELDAMAQLAGLSLHQRLADWGGTAFGRDSRRHVSLFQRPVAA